MNTPAPTKHVSAFQSPITATVKQAGIVCNNTGNKNETTSLKALALLALERNKTRNKPETRPNNSVSSPTTKPASPELAVYADWYEECAAMYQFDAGHSRSESEWQAMNDALLRYADKHSTALGSDELYRFMCALIKETRFNPKPEGNNL